MDNKVVWNKIAHLCIEIVCFSAVPATAPLEMISIVASMLGVHILLRKSDAPNGDALVFCYSSNWSM